EADFVLEQTWGWRGWLLAPHPSATQADLERWLYTGVGEPPAPAPDERPFESSLVGWRGTLEPLRVAYVPELGWVLGCSLLLLAVALGSLWSWQRPAVRSQGSGVGSQGAADCEVGRGRRLLPWAVLLLLGAGVAALLLLGPGLVGPVLYGCEPGAVVLLVILT